MKKYIRTRIFPYKKIYFTIDEAASIIGMDADVLRVFLFSESIPSMFRPRIDYEGNFRLTDLQVSELHKRIIERTKKQLPLFEKTT